MLTAYLYTSKADPMTALTLNQALDNIYASLQNDNAEIDAHISALKSVLAATGQKSVEVDPARLAQNNREGRKTMQAYFRKRGVTVTFK
jgi:hypothetical protein